jgi:hypothetical protein
MKGDMDVKEFKRFLERVIELEYSWTKIKTGYFKRVAISCKNILMQSTPHDIKLKHPTGDAKDNQ